MYTPVIKILKYYNNITPTCCFLSLQYILLILNLVNAGLLIIGILLLFNFRPARLEMMFVFCISTWYIFTADCGMLPLSGLIIRDLICYQCHRQYFRSASLFLIKKLGSYNQCLCYSNFPISKIIKSHT